MAVSEIQVYCVSKFRWSPWKLPVIVCTAQFLRLIIPTPVISSAVNLLATTGALLLTVNANGSRKSGCTRRHPSRMTGRKKNRCLNQGPRSCLGRCVAFHLGVCASRPLPRRFPCLGNAINKSISTRWITFIRLGEIVIPNSASLAWRGN